jgi:hypothetical protein
MEFRKVIILSDFHCKLNNVAKSRHFLAKTKITILDCSTKAKCVKWLSLEILAPDGASKKDVFEDFVKFANLQLCKIICWQKSSSDLA